MLWSSSLSSEDITHRDHFSVGCRRSARLCCPEQAIVLCVAFVWKSSRMGAPTLSEHSLRHTPQNKMGVPSTKETFAVSYCVEISEITSFCSVANSFCHGLVVGSACVYTAKRSCFECCQNCPEWPPHPLQKSLGILKLFFWTNNFRSWLTKMTPPPTPPPHPRGNMIFFRVPWWLNKLRLCFASWLVHGACPFQFTSLFRQCVSLISQELTKKICRKRWRKAKIW